MKCQYSGNIVNSGLKVTFFSVLETAWTANGSGSGTHMNGSCSVPYVAYLSNTDRLLLVCVSLISLSIVGSE